MIISVGLIINALFEKKKTFTPDLLKVCSKIKQRLPAVLFSPSVLFLGLDLSNNY